MAWLEIGSGRLGGGCLWEGRKGSKMLWYGCVGSLGRELRRGMS